MYVLILALILLAVLGLPAAGDEWIFPEIPWESVRKPFGYLVLAGLAYAIWRFAKGISDERHKGKKRLKNFQLV